MKDCRCTGHQHKTVARHRENIMHKLGSAFACGVGTLCDSQGYHQTIICSSIEIVSLLGDQQAFLLGYVTQ